MVIENDNRVLRQVQAMGDSSDINQLKDAEFKEAFDEFDTVSFDLHFHFAI